MNAYSYHNAGDAAIMLASRELMLDLGASEVVLSSRYGDVEAYADHGVTVIPELIPFPSRGDQAALKRLVTFVAASLPTLIAIFAGSINRRLGRKVMRALSPKLATRLDEYSCLVVAGGGYMYSSRRRLNLSLAHSLLTIRAAQVIVDRTVMMPQSIGPVTRRLDAMMINWALRHTSVVTREKVSLENSKFPPRAGLESESTLDVAFYLGQAPVDTPQPKRVARLVVMDWRWSTSVRQDAFDSYVIELAATADALAERGFEVELGGHSVLPEHSQNDLDVARMVRAACVTSPVVDENCDVAHLLLKYRDSAIVIGTRLHACIMALSQGTPAIGIAYQEKSAGVLESVGMGDYVFPADTVSAAPILDAVDRLTGEGAPDIGQAAALNKQTIFNFYAERYRGLVE